jgi:hypothetical protein
MARMRTIKPEFPQSETVGSLSCDARLLFVQLWNVADDAGRFRAASRMLASLLYPYDDDAPNLIGGWLDELEHLHCIRRYEVDGPTYLEIVNWLKHQKIDRPAPSRLPEYREVSTKTREPSRTLDARPKTVDRGPGTKDHGDGLGLRARAIGSKPRKPSKPTPATAENVLIDGPLFKRFSEVYSGKITKAAERKFRVLVLGGENVGPIIAAASRANPYMPAEQWLDERAWEQLSMIPAESAPKAPPAGSISTEARALANEIERVPLSGSAGGSYQGDLTVPLLGVDRVVEVKARSIGFRQLYDWLENRDLLVVKGDRREPLVVLPLRLAVEIALAAEKTKAK